MHCIHCGDTIPDTAKFCPSCGQRVQAAPQVTVMEPTVVPQEESPRADEGAYEAPVSAPEPGYAYGQAAPTYAAPASAQSNDLAIVGFVCSLILIPVFPIGIASSVLGFILSLIGLSKSKQLPEHKGRGLAIAGAVISAIRIALRIIVLVAMIAFLINSAGYAGENLFENWSEIMPYSTF